MTDTPPDWVTQIPNAPIHNLPARQQQLQLPDGDQVAAMRAQFIDTVMQQVTLALKGFFTPGPPGAAFQQLQTWINGFLTTLFGGTTITPTIQSGAVPNISAGTGPGQSADLLTWLTNMAAQWSTQGTNAINAAIAALETQTNMLAGLSSQVQSQQTQSVGNRQSGWSFLVPFGAFPAGAFSVTPFNITYGPIPGGGSAGSGHLVISNSAARWVAVNDGDVSVVAIFNNAGTGQQAFTDTDYQELHASLAGFPNGAGSKNFALLRANAGGTSYVYGLIYLSSSWQLCWEIGCYDASGTHHVFDSGTNAPLNLNFTFRAGVGNDPYRFQGIAGDTVVFDYDDSAHVSAMGSAYRYWGFRSDTASGGQITPAPASYVGCADNDPPVVPGSGFREYCSSSTVIGGFVSSGTFETFPANFFDTVVGESSSDYTVLSSGIWATLGAVQVANAGRYFANIRSDMQAAASTGMFSVSAAIIRLNSSLVQQEMRLLPGVGACFNIVGAQDYTSHFGGCDVFDCEAGDVLIPGYYLDGLGTVSSFSVLGEASGGHSYFSVALANWSLN